MKKGFKISVVTIVTAAASTMGLISVGFATWTINRSDEATTTGGITSDILISMNGFRVKSISTFEYGVYSYGNSSGFTDTGDITYTIGITPALFDPDTIQKLNAGSMTVYGKFNSFYEVFEKTNDSFVNFNGAKWDNNKVVETNSNGNNFLFSFTLTNTFDMTSMVEITKELKFTFNNHLLVKKFGNDTIANNMFILSLGKENFSL